MICRARRAPTLFLSPRRRGPGAVRIGHIHSPPLTHCAEDAEEALLWEVQWTFLLLYKTCGRPSSMMF